MVCAPEVDVIYVEPEKVVSKGRLKPWHMLHVDTVEGRVVDDKELKRTTARKQNFASWLEGHILQLPTIVKRVQRTMSIDPFIHGTVLTVDPKLLAFGYTVEQLNMLMLPMVLEGKEALGSMGNDAPLACMATQVRPIYDYFRQLFAQVTNLPIDPIHENIVMSLESYVGPKGNLLEMKPEQCHCILLKSPVLRIEEMNALKNLSTAYPKWSSRTIDITFSKSEGLPGFHTALDRVCNEATAAIEDNQKVIILSNCAVGKDRVPLSALIACGAVHYHLVLQQKRAKVALMVQTGEAHEVHHLCVLVGYGADAVCPYLVMEVTHKVSWERIEQTLEQLLKNYRKATNNGTLKVMSKMGISTLRSYKGARIFKALGLHNEVVSRCFISMANCVQGATFDLLAMDAFELHEPHVNNLAGIANLQDAVRERNRAAYDAYTSNTHEQIKQMALCGLLDFKYEAPTPIPIEQVEPWNEISSSFRKLASVLLQVVWPRPRPIVFSFLAGNRCLALDWYQIYWTSMGAWSYQDSLNTHAK
ncbi:hypothetical protein RSAG8_12786, partial [Rhizoctonia solani AG-8 WAC10335]